MKQLFFLLCFFLTCTLFGQKLTDRVGEIEIQFVGHYYERDSDLELTNKISNKRNRPHGIMYFGSNGILLKKINFGKHHNTDLRLMDNIIVYEYSANKLIQFVDYESDYQKEIYPQWKTKLLYNDKGQVVDESLYYFEKDSLLNKTTFEYDINSNKTKTIYKTTYYQKRDYDSINRIISLQQIYDGKLQWEWKYTYANNQRLGVFQTHYGDGKDYSKEEIQSFGHNGLLIESEEIESSKIGIDEKIKYFYYEDGIPKRIEHYESTDKGEYKFVYYTDIRIKTKLHLTPETIKKINSNFYLFQ